jgi:hypothetical protein
LSGFACEIDHITPRAQNGGDELDNLCLACSACNGYKGVKTEAVDPQTNQLTPLFNPRIQAWHDHFAWSENGKRLIGLTACGRTTIIALQMNHELVIAARAIWLQTRLHPPD